MLVLALINVYNRNRTRITEGSELSINNVYIIKEKDGIWYGWDEMAEQSIKDSPNRVLSFSKAHFTADTVQELMEIMNASYMLTSEYGFATDHLPKDGTPIEYVE